MNLERPVQTTACRVSYLAENEKRGCLFPILSQKTDYLWRIIQTETIYHIYYFSEQ